jgi:hypothetical protein
MDVAESQFGFTDTINCIFIPIAFSIRHVAAINDVTDIFTRMATPFITALLQTF